MTTKIKVINDAFSRLQISGITVNPTGGDVDLALGRLEGMMAELEAGLAVGYNFDDNPDPNTPTGVNRKYQNMMAANLAVRLCSDFGKLPDAVLARSASGSLSAAKAMYSADTMKVSRYPSRMPIGSGNRRLGRQQRYYPQAPTVPASAPTLCVGDINDYEESFAGYLEGETIASAVVDAGDKLTLMSTEIVDSTVKYRMNAISAGVQAVTIAITTDGGRVSKRAAVYNIGS